MPDLPATYRWLSTLNDAPGMIVQALKLYGTREADGPADNPVILDWAREIGAVGYRHDVTPWCGLFMALVAWRAGWSVPPKPLWALSWLAFGAKVGQAALGDVLAFRRPSGGHVGLYVGEDDSAFHVLGGNQGDRVCIIRVGRDRLAGVRRPVDSAMPTPIHPVRMVATGALSHDEA